MGSDKTSHPTEGAELQNQILRREARLLRQQQRSRAILLHESFGYSIPDVAEALELNINDILGLLAADGRARCAECAFNRHDLCWGHYTDLVRGVRECQCDCVGKPFEET